MQHSPPVHSNSAEVYGPTPVRNIFQASSRIRLTRDLPGSWAVGIDLSGPPSRYPPSTSCDDHVRHASLLHCVASASLVKIFSSPAKRGRVWRLGQPHMFRSRCPLIPVTPFVVATESIGTSPRVVISICCCRQVRQLRLLCCCRQLRRQLRFSSS